MKSFLEATQTKLNTITALKYIDEDWGQMDSYSPNPPTMFPCALIDITDLTFSNIGKDNTDNPVNRQMAEGTITFILGNLKLSNTSQRAPQSQKDNAWNIWTIIDDLHKAVHGWKPTEDSNALIRTRLKRIRRDDGIQEYQITYSIGLSNI